MNRPSGASAGSPQGADGLLGRAAAAAALLGGGVLLLIAAAASVNAGAYALDRLARLAGGSVGGLSGYEDFVRLAASAAAPLLSPYCQLRRGHVLVDVLTRGAPPRIRAALDRISFALVAALALFLSVSMALGAAETFRDGALSRVLGWPEWPFFLPGAAALALWALVAARQAAERGDG